MTTLAQQETRSGSRHRLPGVTILLGGLLTAAGYVLEPTTGRDAVIVPASWLIFSGTLLLIFGLPAFHAGQAARTGALGWWATVTLCAGLALSQLPMSVFGWADRQYLSTDTAFHEGAAGTAEFLGLMVLMVGVIVLAVVTFRAGVYPRWAAWCLAGIVIISLVCQFLPGISSAVRFPAENFVLAGLLGIAALRNDHTLAANEPTPIPVA